MFEEMLHKVEEVVRPLLGHQGYRLIEREFLCEQGRWILRLYIDKEGGGITIDDCARGSRAVEDALEVAGVVDRVYSLEVSSPGIGRPLRYEEDFRAHLGATVKIRTRHPIDGRKHYKGTLEGVSGGVLSVHVDGSRYDIPLELLATARLEGKE